MNRFHISDHEKTTLDAVFAAAAARRAAGLDTPLQAVNADDLPEFKGNMSRDEANRLLAGHPPGTYLFRVSPTQPDAIVLSVLRDNGDVNHVLLQLRPYNAREDGGGYAIVLENGAVFLALADVRRAFAHIARIPIHKALAMMPPSPSFSSLPGFSPTLTSASATNLLTGRPFGEYVMRNSSIPGAFAISYSSPTGVNHLLVQLVPHAPSQTCGGNHTEREGMCLNGRVFPHRDGVIDFLTSAGVLTVANRSVIEASLRGGKRRAVSRRRRPVSRRKSKSRKSKTRRQTKSRKTRSRKTRTRRQTKSRKTRSRKTRSRKSKRTRR